MLSIIKDRGPSDSSLVLSLLFIFFKNISLCHVVNDNNENCLMNKTICYHYNWNCCITIDRNITDTMYKGIELLQNLNSNVVKRKLKN